MDFQKTKIYLDKLNREFARMTKDPENTMRIDVDIMATYVRDLYDAILSESSPYIVQKPEPAPIRKLAPPPVEVVPPTPTPTPLPPIRAEEPPPSPPEVIAPVVSNAPPPPPPAPVSKPEPVRANNPTPAGLEVLFEEKQAKELSEKLAEAPIPDLKKAIALNDRLQFTSELFAGDGKAFENALASLNSYNNYEEAQAYLIEHCAVRYAWTDKKRIEVAKHFVKLVRRRYK